MANGIIAFSQELAQQLVESHEQFPVDFDLAWVWMGYARRDAAVRKLKHFNQISGIPHPSLRWGWIARLCSKAEQPY
jgi:hypothetical protein